MESVETVERKPKAVMAVMGSSGDTKVLWDSGNADEVAAARTQFDALRKKGFLAFSVKRNGDKGEQINAFDETAEKIILCPPMRGG